MLTGGSLGGTIGTHSRRSTKMQSEIENLLPEWVQENICRYWNSDNDEAYTFLRGMTLASTRDNGLFNEFLFLQTILTTKLRILHNLPDREEV